MTRPTIHRTHQQAHTIAASSSGALAPRRRGPVLPTLSHQHHRLNFSCSSAAEGASSQLETSDPNAVNPAVAEALEKVAEALAVAEETAQKVDTLPSARLPTMVSLDSINFLAFLPLIDYIYTHSFLHQLD